MGWDIFGRKRISELEAKVRSLSRENESIKRGSIEERDRMISDQKKIIELMKPIINEKDGVIAERDKLIALMRPTFNKNYKASGEALIKTYSEVLSDPRKYHADMVFDSRGMLKLISEEGCVTLGLTMDLAKSLVDKEYFNIFSGRHGNTLKLVTSRQEREGKIKVISDYLGLEEEFATYQVRVWPILIDYKNPISPYFTALQFLYECSEDNSDDLPKIRDDPNTSVISIPEIRRHQSGRIIILGKGDYSKEEELNDEDDILT